MPAPYQAIEPLSPEQQRIDEREGRDSSLQSNGSFNSLAAAGAGAAVGNGSIVHVGGHGRLLDINHYPPPSPGMSSPWWSVGPSAPPGFNLGSGLATSGVGLDAEAVSRAPPPSRAPSLIRQCGVYVEASSRALSMPLAVRERMQQQMARELAERQTAASLALAPQQPANGLERMSSLPPHPFPAQPDEEDEDAQHDADTDELPPMG